MNYLRLRELSVSGGKRLATLGDERDAPLAELAEHYRTAGAPKGEVTLVVGPPPPAPPVDDDEADRLLIDALRDASPRDAAASVAQATGLPRRILYARAIALRDKRP